MSGRSTNARPSSHPSSSHASKSNRPIWDYDDWQDLPPLRGDQVADVCVIGLGGSGLAAVGEAVALGLDVVGIDAGSVAGGAAGRNGGFLLAGTAAFHHDAVAALGEERATELYRATLDALELMREATPGLVRRTGSLRIAADAEEYDDCEAQFTRMTADGLPVERYAGHEGEGLLFPLDCVLQPLARCRHVARAAMSSGARLFEGTRVLDFDSARVVTADGTVSCGAVIVAIDGGLERLVPEVAGEVNSARLQMLATAPLDERVFDLPVYRRYGYEYYQQLPNGRLALGGFRDRGGEAEWTLAGDPGETVQTLLERFLRDELRVSAEITHRWAATVGFSNELLPVFGLVRGGAVVLGGYSGTGNVIGWLLGREAVRVGVGECGEVSRLFAPGGPRSWSTP